VRNSDDRRTPDGFVEADFADFRCDGRLDDVEVKTGAGDVRLGQTGALRVRSGAGDAR
jgi:hypothetical protein